MDKKGEGFADLKNIMIILLGAIVIFIVSFMIFGYVRSAADAANCNGWVLMKSQKIAGVIEVFDQPNPCITDTPVIESKDKTEVKKVLANEMFDCWKQYGNGKIDFFSDLDFGGSDTYCYVCSRTNVEKDAYQGELDINEFEEYLNTVKPPRLDMTYADYFIGAEAGDAEHVKLDFGDGTIPIKSGTPLYNVFIVRKSGDGTLGFFKRLGLSTTVIYGVGAVACTAATVATGGVAAPCFGFLFTSGAAIGIISTSAVYSSGYSSYYYPSLVMLEGDDLLKKGCDADHMHINYKDVQSEKNSLVEVGK